MGSAFVFVAVFAALFVARVVVATIVFLWILPDGVECPVCNGVTLRVRRPVMNVLLPRFRTSWCADCGWEGLLREMTARPRREVHPREHVLSRRR